MTKKISCVLILSVIAVLGAGPVSAQQQIPFLPELLDRFAQFGSLCIEKQKSGSDQPAVEQARLKSEDAFRRNDLPGLIETISQGIAVLQGKKWDDALKFSNSLALETGATVVQTNQLLRVAIERMYPADETKTFGSTPTVTFAIEPGATSATGQGPEGTGSKPTVLADHLAMGVSSTETEERIRIPDGSYSVVARIEVDGKPVAVLNKPLYAINDFADRISGLLAQIGRIKSSTDPKVKSVAGLVATPEFQVKRLSSLDRSSSDIEVDVPAELDTLNAVVTALEKGENPFASKRGELERAYSAAGQLVPYRVYVPASYDGSRAVPLVVALHGVLGDERSYFRGIYDPTTVKGELDRRGYIMVTPKLAGSSYPQVEADVLEVIKQAMAAYKIDPSRIYLTGHSTGAFAVWQIASDHPEIFAAIAPVSGGSPVQPSQLSALLGKLKGVPIFAAHGAKDGIVAPDQSRKVVEAAKKAGLEVSYVEVPGADHWSLLGPVFPKIMDFFDKNRKQPTAAPN
ncbi:MAG TPA: prolyl oligopeptidase family serine peptidase [Blastocatellia bacterium]|nr:prolyl oligopeptidase family serine peptidase [Blastocatellia bacterium]